MDNTGFLDELSNYIFHLFSLKFIWCIVCPIFTFHICFRAAFKSKTLTVYGAILAFFIGVFLLLSHPIIGYEMLVMFYLGKFATRYGKNRKKYLEFDFSEVRNFYQVLANGSIPLTFSIISCLFIQQDPSTSKYDIFFNKINLECFQYTYNDERYYFILIGSLASLCSTLGDTFSSELGILSKSKPRLITNLSKVVPPGTNGGVTFSGLLAAAFAGFLLGFLTYIFLLIPNIPLILMNPSEVYTFFIVFKNLIKICVFSSLLGSIIDSILGAYFEYSAEHTTTGQVTNNPNSDPKKYRKVTNSINLLTGNQINFLSNMLTAFIVPSIFR